MWKSAIVVEHYLTSKSVDSCNEDFKTEKRIDRRPSLVRNSRDFTRAFRDYHQGKALTDTLEGTLQELIVVLEKESLKVLWQLKMSFHSIPFFEFDSYLTIPYSSRITRLMGL